MKTIRTLFIEALRRRKQRNFKNFYIAIDVHGTIFKPTKWTKIDPETNEEIEENNLKYIPEFYTLAIHVLRILTANENCKLILWTSSKQDKVEMYKTFLEDNDVKVAYINENPDFKENTYSDFSNKFCFDILLDDKAGFDPETDWFELYRLLTETDWDSFYTSLNTIYTDPKYLG